MIKNMAKKNENFQSVDRLLAGVERLYLQIMIGLVPPILFLLIGWWGSLPLVAEESIKFFALGGLLLGLLLDIVFMRRWIQKVYTLPVGWFVAVYLFYSVGMFGFFMGVPVFNLLLGVMGGYYVGICLRHARKEKDEVERAARRTGFFAAGVLAVACLASWVIAFRDPSTAANINGMFHLSNPLSRESILLLSAFAAVGLVALEYFITRATVRFARFQ